MAVQVLDVKVRGLPVVSAGDKILVKIASCKMVPHFAYYTAHHPRVKHFTREVRSGTGHPEVCRMMLPIPGNTLVSRLYQDLQPFQETDHVIVFTCHPGLYNEEWGHNIPPLVHPLGTMPALHASGATAVESLLINSLPPPLHLTMIAADPAAGGDASVLASQASESVHRHHRYLPCAQCGLVGRGFMQCGKCGKVRYCSPACQKAAWKVHKKECCK